MKANALVVALLTIPASSTFAQGFCYYPTGEQVDHATDDITGTSPAASNFYMALLGGSGDFTGWTVQEAAPADIGTNGCYSPQANPALLPEHPKISGGTWPIASGRSYGPDVVGWSTRTVDYIRANSYLGSTTPIIDLPCGAQINQAEVIYCPNDPSQTPYVYVQSQQLTVSVYSAYVTNCRIGACRQEHY